MGGTPSLNKALLYILSPTLELPSIVLGLYYCIVRTYRAIFIASVVLVPLLGLTWAFGILTINADATVFAWLFTIFNSLQVGYHPLQFISPLL